MCAFVIRLCVCVCVCDEGVCVCLSLGFVCVCVMSVCVCACVGSHLRVAKDHHTVNIINHTMHSYIAGIDRFPDKPTRVSKR